MGYNRFTPIIALGLEDVASILLLGRRDTMLSLVVIFGKKMEQERAKELFIKIIAKGIEAIDEFISQREEEKLFLDFIRSSDSGKGTKLSSQDRDNLSKAISGFGNSEGGVIIWGIDCSKDFDEADVAKAKFPIENIDRFISLIESAISGLTTPPHTGIENEKIYDKKGDKSGYVITLIPKSMRVPHLCIYNKHYYIRAGSNFFPTPHDVLAGMFGKRPQPKIIIKYRLGENLKVIRKDDNEVIEIILELYICNDGRGMAYEPFLIIKNITNHTDFCKTRIGWKDSHNWVKTAENNEKYQIFTQKDNYKIPPTGTVSPVQLEFELTYPFDYNLKFEIIAGCEGSEIVMEDLGNTVENTKKNLTDIINKSKNHQLEKCYNNIIEILGIEKKKIKE